MTIGVVATLKVQPGKAEAFEQTFTDLARAVRANEPGNRMYQLTKSRTEPDTYKVLELYADAAALAAHRDMPHFKAAGPALGAVLAAPPAVELLDGID